MELNMLIQALLSQLMGNMGNPFTGNTGGYMQRQSFQPPVGLMGMNAPYSWSGNAFADMMPGMIAQMSGLPFNYAPQVGMGASPLDLAMLRMNGPSGSNYYASQSRGNAAGMAGAWGDSFGRMASNMGVGGAAEFAQAFGASGFGQFGLQAASAAGMLTPMMGGDPFRAQQQLFAQRGLMFGGDRPGGLATGLFDAQGQPVTSRFESIALRTGEFQRTFSDSIYRRTADGERDVLHDLNVTRGFSDEGIMSYVGHATRRGNTSFANARGDVGKMSGLIKSHMEVLSNLGDALGLGTSNEDMNKIVESLEKLTAGRYSHIDPKKMEQNLKDLKPAIQKISAMATIMNVSSQEFMEVADATNMQNARIAGAVYGRGADSMVDPTGRVRYSRWDTATAGVDATLAAGTQAYALAMARGDMTREGLQRAVTQDHVMMAKGMSSHFGVGALGIEYGRQEGLVSQGTYSSWQAAVRSGDRAQQAIWTDRAAFEAGYGNSVGMAAALSNRNERDALYAGLKVAGRQSLEQGIRTAYEAEEPTRLHEMEVGQAHSRTMAAANAAGITARMTPALMKAKVDAMVQALGPDSARGRLLQETFARTGNWSDVAELLGHTGYRDQTKLLRTASADAETGYTLQMLQEHGGEAATAKAVLGNLSNKDTATRSAISRALNAGDYAGAERLALAARDRMTGSAREVTDEAIKDANARITSQITDARKDSNYAERRAQSVRDMLYNRLGIDPAAADASVKASQLSAEARGELANVSAAVKFFDEQATPWRGKLGERVVGWLQGGDSQATFAGIFGLEPTGNLGKAANAVTIKDLQAAGDLNKYGAELAKQYNLNPEDSAKFSGWMKNTATVLEFFKKHPSLKQGDTPDAKTDNAAVAKAKSGQPQTPAGTEQDPLFIKVSGQSTASGPELDSNGDPWGVGA